MTLLSWWAYLTLAIVLAFLMWAFVPILIPILLILACLGVLVALIVGLARWVAPPGEPPPPSQPGKTTITTPTGARRRSDLPD